jgi:hypothetical protein
MEPAAQHIGRKNIGRIHQYSKLIDEALKSNKHSLEERHNGRGNLAVYKRQCR